MCAVQEGGPPSSHRWEVPGVPPGVLQGWRLPYIGETQIILQRYNQSIVKEQRVCQGHFRNEDHVRIELGRPSLYGGDRRQGTAYGDILQSLEVRPLPDKVYPQDHAAGAQEPSLPIQVRPHLRVWKPNNTGGLQGQVSEVPLVEMRRWP